MVLSAIDRGSTTGAAYGYLFQVASIAATRFPDVARCPPAMNPHDAPTPCDHSAKPPRMSASQERPASRTPQGRTTDVQEDHAPRIRGFIRRCARPSRVLAFKPALAQAYPARPVTVIVPWAPAAAPDATARIVAALLEKDLGQPFNVVEPHRRLRRGRPFARSRPRSPTATPSAC